jgi:hypothetical protein
MFPLRGAVGPDGLRQAQRGQLKLDRGGSCVGTIDCIRRIMMPRLGLSRSLPVAGGGFEQCYNAQAVVATESLLVHVHAAHAAKGGGGWVPFN